MRKFVKLSCIREKLLPVNFSLPAETNAESAEMPDNIDS